jgi:site-specific DNA-methyltransferase (adenine-specific)
MNVLRKKKKRVAKVAAESKPYTMGRKFTRSFRSIKEGVPTARLTTTHGILFQMDCLDFLPTLPSETVHCVFADPPFNLNKYYGNGFGDDARAEGAYLAWCYRWIEECSRVLVPGGALFIYALPRWAFRFAAKLDEPMQFCHWIALTMKGSFPRGQKLYPAHYALLYFTKGAPRVFNRLRLPIPTCRHCGGDLKDYGGHRKYLNPAGLNLTDFWEDTSPNRHKGWKTRPGVNELKPMIPARAIEISTRPGDIVLDPFGGGGTTYQEAERLGRFWIGCEIGDCDAIEKRMRAFSSLSLGAEPPREVLQVISSYKLNLRPAPISITEGPSSNR